MQIETFECPEVSAEPLEASEEAIGLIESLGLGGQRELIAKHSKSGRETRLPYRQMLKDEMAVYKTLCPKSRKLEEYEASPIPLRVLQVAAHAKSLLPSEFHLYVWDREAAEIPDPVLIATNSIYEFSTGRVTYLLARWGEHLETFETLVKRVAAQKRESLKAAVAEASMKIEAASTQAILHASLSFNI